MTVHGGRVSFAARNLQGVAHVQVNADVNPGNSGGPLLDGGGRVVGIVTLKAEGAGGVGFALPIEYARPALELPTDDPAARERWAATFARVGRDDDAETKQLVERLQRPLLWHTGTVGGQLAVQVVQRWPSGPSASILTVEVRDGAKVLCEPSGELNEWTPLEEKLREASERIARLEERRRILRRALDRQDDARLIREAERDLPAVEADLARAHEALDDLERKASHAAIPREWRG